MNHVPEWRLMKYRQIKRLADQFKSLGDTIGPNDMADSTICWRLAKKYQDKANLLRDHAIVPQYVEAEHRYQCEICKAWINYSEETGRWSYME
jgi:hypothetical protein